jgi:hypothetical protein
LFAEENYDIEGEKERKKEKRMKVKIMNPI